MGCFIWSDNENYIEMRLLQLGKLKVQFEVFGTTSFKDIQNEKEALSSSDLVIVAIDDYKNFSTQFHNEIVSLQSDTKVCLMYLINKGLGVEDMRMLMAFGADDIQPSWIDPVELVARIDAILRRDRGDLSRVYTVGNMSISAGRVSVGSHSIHLTGMEYDVLEFGLKNLNRLISTEAFMSYLYGDMDRPEHSILDVYICKIRKKLHGHGFEGLIETVFNEGYRFVNVESEVANVE